MASPEEIGDEARWRQYNDPVHHARVHLSMQVLETELRDAGIRLTPAIRRGAVLAASIGLTMADVDPATGEISRRKQ